MSDKEDNILRDGTSQKNRNESGLQLEKVLVDGRDMEYFLNFVAKFSEKIRFYDRSNAPAGTWDAFFPPQAVINDFISKLPSTDGLPPQLGLFVAFTQMMGILKGDINQLSKRHLQFYFEKV